MTLDSDLTSTTPPQPGQRLDDVEFQPFPSVHADIQRLIFEVAADDSRETACRLVLVAKYVQRWVDPILYHSVTMKNKRVSDIYEYTLRHATKPAGFFATFVKSICVWTGIPLEQTFFILSQCRNIQTLAYWHSLDSPELFSLLESLPIHPSRISVFLPPESDLSDRYFTMPIFQNVTLLEVVYDDTFSNPALWSNLQTLARLTHLSLDFSSSSIPEVGGHIIEYVWDVLDHCPNSLQICIVTVEGVPDIGFAPKDAFLRDQRLVFISACTKVDDLDLPFAVHFSMNDIVSNWGYTPPGTPELWKFAEETNRRCRSKVQTLNNS